MGLPTTVPMPAAHQSQRWSDATSKTAHLDLRQLNSSQTAPLGVVGDGCYCAPATSHEVTLEIRRCVHLLDAGRSPFSWELGRARRRAMKPDITLRAAYPTISA